MHQKLQHTATHCNTLQHTATHCNALQHATHCNTLQHTTTTALSMPAVLSTPNNTLQHTSTLYNTHCNTHCNTQCNTHCNGGVQTIHFGVRVWKSVRQCRTLFSERIHRALLQKRPIILRSLLIVANPYDNVVHFSQKDFLLSCCFVHLRKKCV